MCPKSSIFALKSFEDAREEIFYVIPASRHRPDDHRHYQRQVIREGIDQCPRVRRTNRRDCHEACRPNKKIHHSCLLIRIPLKIFPKLPCQINCGQFNPVRGISQGKIFLHKKSPTRGKIFYASKSKKFGKEMSTQRWSSSSTPCAAAPKIDNAMASRWSPKVLHAAKCVGRRPRMIKSLPATL